tara:strand:+ start:224 stop:829 length:606 start_codon:yes stop_codon:yes gene_type:complete
MKTKIENKKANPQKEPPPGSETISEREDFLPAMIERVFQENFNSDDMCNVDDHVKLLIEFIVKNNMKIQSTKDLLVAAFQLHTKPDRMCDWSQISEGLEVDYGQKRVSLFGSKWCEYKTLAINTKKNKVEIELLNLEDVEWLAAHLGRELTKYTCEESGSTHWSVERGWHHNTDRLCVEGETLQPPAHNSFDYIEIGCWKH